MFTIIILLFLLSFAITLLLTPGTIILANKFGLVDHPALRSHPAQVHKGVIPRAGGIPIFLGIFLPVFFFLAKSPILWGIILSGVLLTVVGIWDDVKDRSPYIRLFTNFLAASLVVSLGVNIPYITNPLNGVIHLDKLTLLPCILALVWVVWTTNIVGWSGGVDGQLPGFVAISALVIGFLSLRFSIADPKQTYVTYLSFLTAGSFLGFLPWNFYPQKIMPGYGGKTLAGFILAVLSILSFTKLGTALLVLALPLTDASFIFFKRILSGKSPVWPSAEHLHHHLLDIGWSKKRIALFYWLISGMAGVVALSLSSEQKVFAAFFIFVVIAGFILFMNFFRKRVLGGK